MRKQAEENKGHPSRSLALGPNQENQAEKCEAALSTAHPKASEIQMKLTPTISPKPHPSTHIPVCMCARVCVYAHMMCVVYVYVYMLCMKKSGENSKCLRLLKLPVRLTSQ